MTIASRLTFVSSLLAVHAARAQPIAPETSGTQQVEHDAAGPIEDAEPAVVRPRTRANPLATTERWGGGVRVTGLSGIGALPGVNFGIEVAGLVRRDEYFVELALGRWKPEDTHLVTETPERVELGLDVWTLRGGWTSMTMPLRAWLLGEVGEVAGARGMPGVVTRMVMGDTPQQRQWRAVGVGFGVAWPMSDQARLIGNMEFAVPINRERLVLDGGEVYEPDPLAARYSVGLEVGWR